MPRPGHVITLCVLALLAIGVVMVNSADMAVRSVSGEQPVAGSLTLASLLTSRSAIYMMLACIALTGAAFLPIRRLAAWAESPTTGGMPVDAPRAAWRTYAGLAVGTLALLVTCAMVYLPGLQRAVNGSSRWISIPGTGDALSLQPSELAKWGMVVLVAWYCVRAAMQPTDRSSPSHPLTPSPLHERGLSRFLTGLCPALGAVGVVAGFIVLEDLGTGALIVVVAALMLAAGGWMCNLFSCTCNGC